MTDLFRTDFSAGLPLQISKHIARLVSGTCLPSDGLRMKYGTDRPESSCCKRILSCLGL